ncbi:MAG: hypothetical protein C0402_06455 [Thermodesulfovibrio sp.]|nr:hypothetical protein [Thermodesulfovibrio sp.]
MVVKWRKLGHIFEPANNYLWMQTHASNPVAVHIAGDAYRIYFSCRDKTNVSSIGYIDIDLKSPFKIVSISEEPVLGPGDLGTFDDSGTSLCNIIRVKGVQYLYYLGWNLSVLVPWRNSIGMAVYNEPAGKYEKIRNAPIMDRSSIDPFSLSYCFVMQDNDIFRMWYGSNLSWGKDRKDMAYVIKYADSNDGIDWRRDGDISLNFNNDAEYALARPCVIKDGHVYKMWYSYRGLFYRIGYAESKDGINWNRKDELVGIDVSQSGWDSEMICYPNIFDHNGQRYMLYNGNGYGRSGFGLAVLDHD